MRKLLISLFFAAFILPTWQVSASPQPEANNAPLLTPGQIISGINSYRAANGLPPYQSNSTLMQLAQGQADYQASIETVTHTGPGGTRPIDRAYAIGYGEGNTVFVSEIIYGGYTATVEIAITWWKGSSIHNSTMLASTYQEIGAGVASSGDRMFFTAVTGYVVGAPAPANAGVPSASNEGETTAENEVPAVPPVIIIPVTKSEPQEDGSIIHVVRTGQALWNIAAVYDVPLEELLEINNLPQNAIIFSGDEIIVQEATEPIVETEPTEAAPSNTLVPTATSPPTPNATEVAVNNIEEAAEDGVEGDAVASAAAALQAADQDSISSFFQGSSARWIVVVAFVGLLGVLGTSLVLQQRTVETAPATGNLDPLTTPLNVALSSEAAQETAFEELAKEEQVERLQRLGEVALMAYDLNAVEIKPIKYWLNASFKLESSANDEDEGRSYLLRVHNPHVHSLAEVRSEMQWLVHLREHSEIQIPAPVKNVDRKWVTMMDVPGVPEKRACTILEWQTGKQVSDQKIIQKQIRQAGTLMAQLHIEGQQFKPPKGFSRPRWDLEGLQGAALGVKGDMVRDNLSNEQLETLDAAADQVSSVITELENSTDAFGLIHGDLGASSLLFDGDQTKAIDFDSSGWGYYVYDLATSLVNLRGRADFAKLKIALLKGYRSVRDLPDEQAAHIESFMAGHSMSQIYWLSGMLDQPAFQETAKKHIKQQFDHLDTLPQ